ncbi:MAG: lipid IV(A) 3-deoxy-D-manno-octulosonic acid transferase [Rhodocyclaceae bacterium]|nr:lipid IV(A) 3-deoxy-D-manno-octulosonic acid transferase [Rhodocyclaceae bacterium]
MPRFLYSIIIFALLPWAALHLLWRARRQPQYLHHWSERFGFFAAAEQAPTIWIHAVSVGETRAAQPLVAALRARYPGHRILLSHMTPTGRQTSTDLFGADVARCYLPYDTPWATRRFLRHFRPQVGIIMETELWPNAIAACRAAGVPLLLVNARLSEKSARRYARFPRLTRQALAGLSAISAVGSDDARRLADLGANDVAVFGNLKFDIEPPAEQLLRAQEFRRRCGARPIFLCASTREGEEALILDAWKAGTKNGALLVIVPRHPQRFAAVAALAAARGYKVCRRSAEGAVAADTDIWIGDSMGEMFAYYAAADVAFVGGSLLDYGSQNLIEPCAVGTPVLIGPSIFNFRDAAQAALACGAALAVSDAPALVATATALLADDARRRDIGNKGKAFAASHRGATARNVALIERFIPAAR